MEIGNKKYIQRIKTFPCSHCHATWPSECHHLSSDMNQSGMGMKSPDLLTMPLCSRCHRAFHEADRRLWEDKEHRMQDQRLWLLKALINAMEEGVLVAGDIKDLEW